LKVVDVYLFAFGGIRNHPPQTTRRYMSGKASARYPKNGGLLLAPQLYPNAMSCANFPSMVLKPGEEYHYRTKYQFAWD